MSTDNIDKLYKNYEILSEAKDKSIVSIFHVFVVVRRKKVPRDNSTHYLSDKVSL